MAWDHNFGSLDGIVLCEGIHEIGGIDKCHYQCRKRRIGESRRGTRRRSCAELFL